MPAAPVRRVLGLTRLSLVLMVGFQALFLLVSWGIWFVCAFAYCGNQEGCARKDVWTYLLGAVMATGLCVAVPFFTWRGTRHPFWKWAGVVIGALVLGWFGAFGAFVQ